MSLPPRASIPYYDHLLRLAICQRDLGVPVRFKFERVSGSERETIVVYPVADVPFRRETLPLFNFLDLDPLQLWVNFGYAEIVTGSIVAGAGVFALTPQALNLKLVRTAK